MAQETEVASSQCKLHCWEVQAVGFPHHKDTPEQIVCFKMQVHCLNEREKEAASWSGCSLPFSLPTSVLGTLRLSGSLSISFAEWLGRDCDTKH